MLVLFLQHCKILKKSLFYEHFVEIISLYDVCLFIKKHRFKPDLGKVGVSIATSSAL